MNAALRCISLSMASSSSLGLHTGNAERNNLKAAQVAPFSREHFVECVSQFHRVARKRRVADAHVGNLRKCRLKRGQKFGFQLSIQTVAGIALPNIAADVRVKQNRVANAVAVFAEAANGDVDVNAGPLVNNTKRNRRRSSVLVADKLFGIEIVNSLILWRLAAKGEAFSNVLERIENTGSQVRRRR